MASMVCSRCGAACNRSGGQALYCLPCTNARKPRLASEGRERNGYVKPLQLGGKWCCIDCRLPVGAASDTRNRRPKLRCGSCAEKRKTVLGAIRNTASRAVAKAIESGLLERPGKFSCVDCGRKASQYDHRDYTKPLSVEPVCRSCNVMRGPADVWSHFEPLLLGQTTNNPGIGR